MEDFNYDSYCGNYCGACEILNAYKNGTGNEIAALWGASPEEIKCLGCKTGTVFKNCTLCGIRKCAMEKGVQHCVSCGEFPCRILESGKSLVDQLPHLKAIPQNMRTIKKKGAKYWLREQEAKWRCPDCGAPFSWYKEKCSGCGRDLGRDKDFMDLEAPTE
jgi:hypothetical protein